MYYSLHVNATVDCLTRQSCADIKVDIQCLFRRKCYLFVTAQSSGSGFSLITPGVRFHRPLCRALKEEVI